MEAWGGFSNTKKAMVYFMDNRFQISTLRDLVLEAAPAAYVTISEVADVIKMNQEG